MKALALLLLLTISLVSAHPEVPATKLVTYINKVNQYWPLEPLFQDLAIPSYAPDNMYNVYIYTFWLSGGPADTALIFSNALTYFSSQNPFGNTNQEIQENIVDLFHKNNKLLLVSAFGATENPTTEGKDPTQTCTNLAQFVLENNFDGVDVDWEDNEAMEHGTGEQWLITCTKVLRQYLPKGKYIITHAPQAPYFTGTDHYPNGGYVTIHKEVGDLIDWYNVQFYNQGYQTTYDSYEKLFLMSGGDWAKTAVGEIITRGIDKEHLVVGKPVTPGDATNSGYVNPVDLGHWAYQAQSDLQWSTGLMTWQYSSDLSQSFQYVTDYVENLLNNKFKQHYQGIFDRGYGKDSQEYKSVVKEMMKLNKKGKVIEEETIVEESIEINSVN